MLLILLLASLAGLANTSPFDINVWEHKVANESLEQVISYLKTSDLDHLNEPFVFFTLARCNSPWEAWVAVLEKLGHQKMLGYAAWIAINYNRFDLLKVFVEKGYGVLCPFPFLTLGGGLIPFDHMGWAEFYCDHESNFMSQFLDFVFATFEEEGNDRDGTQRLIQTLYFFIDKGLEFDAHQILRLISKLDLNPGDYFQSPGHYEFAQFLMERTESVDEFAAVLSCAVRFNNSAMIERLLQFPEVFWYLHLAKYAKNVLLQTNGELTAYFEPIGEGEDSLRERRRKIYSEKLNGSVYRFKALTLKVGQERTLLEPLTVQDLQLVVTPQTDACMRFFLHVLGQAYSKRFFFTSDTHLRLYG